MLEIRHINKTYTPKHGVPVKALDDVSLKFEDKGIVFILGKSGSGKSTLLNVLGGLDRADSGEFLIKGKSSNNFTQSDFDSYRNTFIGFIFQEYNILPEFTVGANIALAMQLQGKKATNEALNAILDEVDLTGYGNRKPNELSGGQKQRVAIARALVKNPEMIMADEPTGALDSRTGKQVFDTLKKLSKEKLVLVVSHDRDFAELYADRIIELKDGKIISDVSKISAKPNEISSGVCAVDEHVLRVKKGYTLTDHDLELIRKYIENADDDTIISTDGKNNTEVKKVLKMNDDGGKDTFVDTRPDDVKLKDYTPADSKLVRSRLPFKNSLKIGASSLKVKPFRLILTILLCVVAFAMFGLTDTMAAYDKYTTYERSIADAKIDGAAFTKTRFREYSYYKDDGTITSGNDSDDSEIENEKDGYFYETKLSDSDIKKIGDTLGIQMLPVYSPGSYSSISFSSSIANSSKLSSDNGSIYNMSMSGFCEIDQSTFDNTGLKLSAGRIPSATSEILITNFVYDQFAIAGMRGADATNPKFTPTSPDEILNKTLTLSYQGNDFEFKIVGVAETNFNTSKYADYLPGAQKIDTTIATIINMGELETQIKYSFHSIAFVAPGTIDALVATTYDESSDPINTKNVNNFNYYISLSSNSSYTTFNYIASLSALSDHDAIVWTDGEKTTLGDNEILLPYSLNNSEAYCSDSLAAGLVEAGYYDVMDKINLTTKQLSEIIYELTYYSNAYLAEAKKDFPKGYPDAFKTQQITEGFIDNTASDEDIADLYCSYLADYGKTSDGYTGGYFVNEYGTPGYLYVRKAYKLIASCEDIGYNKFGDSGIMEIQSENNYSRKNYNVVGYYFPTLDFMISNEAYADIGTPTGNILPMIVGDTLYNSVAKSDEIYSFCIGKMPYDNASKVRQIVEFNYTNFGRIRYQLNNEVSSTLEMVNSLVETLSQVFLYIGIGFAVFAALMLFNFISVSISYKKREIGILRAVGARGADVFGIFFNESMIITLINWVLASAVTVIGATVINNSLRNTGGFSLTLLNVGIHQFVFILAIGIVVAFISTFLPVLKISRKRPIDAIRNK